MRGRHETDGRRRTKSSPHHGTSEKDETVTTLQLGDFDSHGTTRARYRGRWIEVEHGIPGETVRVEVMGQRRLYGRIVDVLDPAPDRVEAPCVYFRHWSCGGCQWQQISYQGQSERKRESVERAMLEAGLSLSVDAIHTLSAPWRYRSTAGISLGKRAGFRRHGSLAIVPIRDCPISHPLIGRLMAVLNVRLEAGTLPDFRGRVRLEVRVVEAADGERLQILVRPTEEGTMPGASDLRILTDVLAELDEVQAIAVWRPDGSVKPLVGELFATTNVAGRPILLSAASFFQTNLELLGRLITRLQEEVDRHAGRRSGEYLPRVADIYGGVGIFGLFLVERAGDVVIVESDPLAVEAGRLTAERWGLSNVRFVEAAAEEALEDAGGYDVVILDPPRSGLSPAVAEALVESRPPLILYVSCLAQSLARDLKIFLEAGYEVEHLELFDFYPQTYHVELLAVLRLPWPFPP